MTLMDKERRELIIPGSLGIGLIIFSGTALHWISGIDLMTASDIHALVSMFSFLALILAAFFGAVPHTGEQERGTQEFLRSLPVTRQHIWAVKTAVSAGVCSLMIACLFIFMPGQGNLLWIGACLLAFAFANLAGLILPALIHAGLVGFIFSLAGLMGAMESIRNHPGMGIIWNCILLLVAMVSLLGAYLLERRKIV